MLAAEDPMMYEESVRSSEKNEWKLSLRGQLDSMERSNTWAHAVLWPGKDTIPCNVVLKRMNDEQERIDRYKARLVTKDYVQKDGVGYEETFLPVVPFDVLLPIVGKLTSVDWHVHLADLSNAFLNGDMNGEVYVR